VHVLVVSEDQHLMHKTCPMNLQHQYTVF